MKKIFSKIWKYRYAMRSLFPTIYFNFHYLPFKQAIRLPIILYKPKLISCKGKINIEPINGKIYPGMIKLGFKLSSIYPDSGIVWENNGATVTFRGKCLIGNHSFLTFGDKAKIDIGDDLMCACFKLVSYVGVKFGQSTRFGWNVLCMDTNFHPLYDIKQNKFKKASGPIVIGDFNWFGTDCRIMHSVKTPERCIFGMGTIVTRGCKMKSYSVMGGNPVCVLTENVMRIIGQDTETYSYL